MFLLEFMCKPAYGARLEDRSEARGGALRVKLDIFSFPTAYGRIATASLKYKEL